MQLIKALLCQILAGLIVVLSAPALTPPAIGGATAVCLQAMLAALLSVLLRQPGWWRPIHLLFMPGIWLMLMLQLPSWLYLAIFTVLLLAFWGTVKGDVPLFLSSAAVTDNLAELIEHEHAPTLIELGAGIGSVVVPLAERLPHLKITAVERAPLPWLILTWRCRHLGNVSVLRKSLWDCQLENYAMAFAFLSPLVMRHMGEKCLAEMPAGSLFVSSSFVIPDWTAEKVLRLEDRRNTRLYCYRLPERR